MRKFVVITIIAVLLLTVLPFAGVGATEPDHAPVYVERGRQTMEYGVTVLELHLDTPVPVGESFVISSSHGAEGAAHDGKYLSVMVELLGIVDDNYTKLRFTRTYGDYTTHIEWQVITGKDFTVLTGQTEMPGATVDVDVAPIIESETFITQSVMCTHGLGRGALVTAEFLDISTMRLSRSMDDGITTSRWYIVTWEGATVQSGFTNVPGAWEHVSIAEVDLSKTFVIHTQLETSLYSEGKRAALRVHFLDSTTLEFRRDSTWNSASAAWFVVSHPSIYVQQGHVSLASIAAATETLGTSVDLDRAFTVHAQYGNSMCSIGWLYELHHYYETHTLWQDGDYTRITLQRGSDVAELSVYYQVVHSFVDEPPEPPPPPPPPKGPMTERIMDFIVSVGFETPGDRTMFSVIAMVVAGAAAFWLTRNTIAVLLSIFCVLGAMFVLGFIPPWVLILTILVYVGGLALLVRRGAHQ